MFGLPVRRNESLKMLLVIHGLWQLIIQTSSNTGHMGKRVCITGSIASGKSRLAKFLNELGVETLDADDVAHELVSPEERERLRKTVFKDPSARAALEARLHPLIKARLDAWQNAPSEAIRAVIIPLLFEVHWEKNYDIICAVVCDESRQISRMMENRGYTREEALARIGAQIPGAEKAKQSHYTIRNDGSEEELKNAAREFVRWLKREEKQ